LYDVKNDIGETKNLENKYPALVKMLTSKINKMIAEGRSTTGSVQKNDVRVVLNKKLN
jgi:arylsulfatase A